MTSWGNAEGTIERHVLRRLAETAGNRLSGCNAGWAELREHYIQPAQPRDGFQRIRVVRVAHAATPEVALRRE